MPCTRGIYLYKTNVSGHNQNERFMRLCMEMTDLTGNYFTANLFVNLIKLGLSRDVLNFPSKYGAYNVSKIVS